MDMKDLKNMARNVGDVTSDFAVTAGKKTSKVAKNIGEMTGDVLEISKLNLKIKSEQSKIAEKKEKLGDYYYKKYKTGFDDEGFANMLCEEIREHENIIAEAEMQIANVKNN